MLLTQFVDIIVNGRNIKYYENKGYVIPRHWNQKHKKMLYKCGTKIIVAVQDLMRGSHAKVDVKCDYCGRIKNVAYKDYLSRHDENLGDCCVKCRPVKYKETMLEKYGVENINDLPEFVEKRKETNRQKYGCDYGLQSPIVQAKSRKTMLERYGVERPLQVKEFSDKAMQTRCKNFTNPTSKPQLKLSYLLLELYGNCQLEKPCGRYSLDCVVNINNILIDIEYDGAFWHQDEEKDKRRDIFVKKQGYKVLRVKGVKKDPLPSKEQIDEKIQELLLDSDYAEIQM